MTMAYTIMASPLGLLRMVASEQGLIAVLWPDDDPKRVPLGAMAEDVNHPILRETARQLDDYFSRRSTTFDVPLDLRGTAFQRTVWAALRTIPFGETRSYAAIAARIGRPAAVRAVGAANGRNPLSIIVPCHRVIGSGGALTGFAGGMAAKERLLRLERGGMDLFDGL